MIPISGQPHAHTDLPEIRSSPHVGSSAPAAQRAGGSMPGVRLQPVDALNLSLVRNAAEGPSDPASAVQAVELIRARVGRDAALSLARAIDHQAMLTLSLLNRRPAGV